MKPYIEVYYHALDIYGGAERVCIPYGDLYAWLQRKTNLAQELSKQFIIISVRCIDSPN